MPENRPFFASRIARFVLVSALCATPACLSSSGEDPTGEEGGTNSGGTSSGGTSSGGSGASNTGGGANAGGAGHSGGAVDAGSGGGGDSGGSGGADPDDTPVSCESLSDFQGVTQTFSPPLFAEGADPSSDATCTEVLNPERGFFEFRDLRSLGNLSGVRAAGRTLIYGKILIDDYRTQDLDEDLLSQLEGAFAQVRAAGLKVLPRFYYADDGSSPDASLAQVTAHIAQLRPLLTDNSDVIAVLHAGFVGAWGEWHSSSNNLTEPAARKEIFDALLAVLPSDRQILARRPSHKEVAYGGPLTAETAFQDTSLARVGHLNDCFLASDSDMGTYQLDGEKDYAISDSAFTAVGGETCAVNPPRSECASALDELGLHHFSFLNMSYHTGVLDSWETGGCEAQIACRLGYRFLLKEVEVQEVASAPGPMHLRFELFNDGFGRLYNARPLRVVLDGPTEVSLLTSVDLRDIAPGQSAEYCLALDLPDHLPSGSYAVRLHSPDAAESLATDPRYALHLSNVAFDPTSGTNETGVSVQIGP